MANQLNSYLSNGSVGYNNPFPGDKAPDKPYAPQTPPAGSNPVGTNGAPQSYSSYLSGGGNPQDWYNRPENGGPGTFNLSSPGSNTYQAPTYTDHPISGSSPIYTPDGTLKDPYSRPFSPGVPGVDWTQSSGGVGGGSGSTGSGTPGPTSFFPNSKVPTTNPFGQNPFLPNPTGNGPRGSYGFNPNLFATKDTADQFAKMFGGTVVSQNNILDGSGPFSQDQPNYMIRMPDGHMVNPATIAGYYQSQSGDNLRQLVQGEIDGQGTNPYPHTATSGTAITRPPVEQFAPQAPQQAPQFVPQATPNPAQLPQPFDFGALVSQLYGSNPFQAASGGNNTLAALLSLLGGAGQSQQGSGGGDAMGSIAAILNAIYSQRSSVNNGALSPLFWGSGQQVPSSQYYPTFY